LLVQTATSDEHALYLGFIAITDRLFFKLFMSINRLLTIIPDLRLTSLFILILAYVWIRKSYPSQLQPQLEGRKRTLRLAIIWLIMTAYFVLIQKVWVPKLNDWLDRYCFSYAHEFFYADSKFRILACRDESLCTTIAKT